MRKNKQCLNEFELGAYIEGKLSSKKKELIEKYLSEDRHCMDEFIAINHVINQKDSVQVENAPEYLIEKVINYNKKHNLFDVIVSVVKDAINVVYASDNINIFTPLPAHDLRNAGVSGPIMVVLNKNFENINVELDIEKVANNFCNIKAVVSDIETKTLLESLRVELISEGRELVSAPLENGVVILEDIKPGRYIIKINKKGKIMGELSVKIE